MKTISNMALIGHLLDEIIYDLHILNVALLEAFAIVEHEALVLV
jgi:hypothetical protein